MNTNRAVRFSMEMGFLTAKGRGSGNSVKEKGLSMDDGLDVGNGGKDSGSFTSNIDANIIKEDVCNIPIWIKFHDVPITTFTNDRLSAITTKLGSPFMLNSYTVAMSTDSWGRTSYARAMIEPKADVDLRDTIVVVPKFSGEEFTMSIIHVEYDWAPPRCPECKVFGHVLDDCPKKIVSDILKNSKMPRQPASGPPVGLKRGGNQTPSTNATPVVAKINELERQMLNEKLMLVDEHGKSLEMKVTDEASTSKPSTSMWGPVGRI
ncbi:RNA-directed DNA polymerase, eukaryota [Tanacetum coccineum]